MSELVAFINFLFPKILLERAVKKKKKIITAEGDSDVVNTYSRISKAILNTPLRAIQRLQKNIDSCKINIPM